VELRLTAPASNAVKACGLWESELTIGSARQLKSQQYFVRKSLRPEYALDEEKQWR
jgi:hypothetical protein